jgi:hypothetical protein
VARVVTGSPVVHNQLVGVRSLDWLPGRPRSRDQHRRPSQVRMPIPRCSEFIRIAQPTAEPSEPCEPYKELCIPLFRRQVRSTGVFGQLLAHRPLWGYSRQDRKAWVRSEPDVAIPLGGPVSASEARAPLRSDGHLARIGRLVVAR